MIGVAWAADAAGEHAGFWSQPELWVGIAFFLFFALVGKTLWRRVSAMLDKRAADIVRALADAERLRDEALKAKTEAESTLARAASESDAILRHAREEAERMQARAAAGLKTQVALREQQALDRIAQSEAAVAKQVPTEKAQAAFNALFT